MQLDRIQDLREFEERIFDAIQEYVDNIDNYPADAVLAINDITKEFVIDKNDEYPQCTTYKIVHLVCFNENGHNEPDADAINELASKYIFVR